MTNEELNKLEQLALRATPGEWKFWTSNSWRRLIASNGPEDKPVIMPFTARTDNHPDMSIAQADMDYIEAVQPATVIRLIQAIQGLRQLLSIAEYWMGMEPMSSDEIVQFKHDEKAVKCALGEE